MTSYELIPVQGARCPRGSSGSPIYNTARATGQYGGCPCCCELGGEVSAESGSVAVHVVDVRLSKTVTPACVGAGESVTYTIAVHNASSLPITGVTVSDPALPECFEVGTIRVNGALTGGDLVAGLPVPEIGAGAVAVVTVQAVPRAECGGVIENVARVEFQAAGCCGEEAGGSVLSNRTVLRVLRPELTVTKQADRCCLTREENEVTYTVTATNTGNCALSGVVVTDILPAPLEYVPGSTQVNGGEAYDRAPALGVHVGALEPQESAVVAFRARRSFEPVEREENGDGGCGCGCGCGG